MEDEENDEEGQFISPDEILNKLPAETREGAERYVRLQYALQQEALRREKVASLVVYRGMRVEEAGLRGPGRRGQAIEVDTDALTSFTTDKEIASSFADENAIAGTAGGLAAKFVISAKHIFSTRGYGIDSLPESEVVVLGGKFKGRIVHIARSEIAE